MREIYIPNQHSYNAFKKIIQTGGGMDELGYIYDVQKGSGLGSFFKNLLKIALPISKRIISKGVTIAKPHLKKIAQEGIATATDVGINSIRKYSQKAQDKIGKTPTKKRKSVSYKTNSRKKRKIDQLS